MGPLQGFRIVEIAGIGPSQFCGMLLSDMGAEVVRVIRTGSEEDGDDAGLGIPPELNLMNRNRTTIRANLKQAVDVRLVLGLCSKADALFEGFRPGVMERLGLGPEDCQAANERLVYGRMTGWGQSGPLAQSAGHDANYSALTGVIAAIGENRRPPSIPLNLVADFGGGGTYLAIGILAALLEASRSGRGQVVDAAMVDGAASLMTAFYGLHAGGLWRDERGSNVLDGGAPFYRVYPTSDDKFVVVGAIERRFFVELLDKLGITDVNPEDQFDAGQWPRHIATFEAVFASRTRAHWSALLESSDACLTPVLTMAEARRHPHNLARETFVDVDGVVQPAPAPRFSRTRSTIRHAPSPATNDVPGLLAEWGLEPAAIEALTTGRH